MLHLTLAGVSEDNKRLLLVSDSGEEFSLPIDKALRAALRGEHARLGQLEIQMESTLRPRDIQARIRAGASPESVAQAAHTTVEKIMPFANPVLAERAHIADRAQRASVRRRAGEQGARTLGEAVEAKLSGLQLTDDIVAWDSWRREDGRWQLTGAYAAGKRKGTAEFVFDAPGNYVTLENDDARWLVGEASEAKPRGGRREESKDDLRRARQRRLSAVPEEELPLGDDAIEIANESASDSGPEESTVDLTETAEQVRAVEQADEDATLSPTPEPLAHEPAAPADEAETRPEQSAAETEPETESEPPQEAEAASQPEPPKPAKKPARKKGRASVPSWDEIMFGGGKQD